MPATMTIFIHVLFHCFGGEKENSIDATPSLPRFDQHPGEPHIYQCIVFADSPVPRLMAVYVPEV